MPKRGVNRKKKGRKAASTKKKSDEEAVLRGGVGGPGLHWGYTGKDEVLRNEFYQNKPMHKIHAGLETIPRVRVSWQGCITEVNYLESPLIESPAYAVDGRDAIPRFMQTDMTAQEHQIAALYPSGSRDDSSCSVRKLYHPITSDMTQARCGSLFTPTLTATGEPVVPATEFLQLSLTFTLRTLSTLQALTGCDDSHVLVKKGKKSATRLLALLHHDTRPRSALVTDDSRVWFRGSLAETSMYDKLSLIRAKGHSRGVRDMAHAHYVRTSTVVRGCRPGLVFCGDIAGMVTRCAQVQASYWAWFHAHLNHLVNTLARKTAEIYTHETGFTRSVHPISGNLSIVPHTPASRVQVETLELADALAGIVVAVMQYTPCALEPWVAANIFYTELARIAGAIDDACKRFERSDIFELVGRRRTTMAVRHRWMSIVKELFTLQLYFRAAMHATSVIQVMVVEGSAARPGSIPFQDLYDMRKADPKFYGYRAARSEYRRYIMDGTGEPAIAFVPFNGNLFAAYVCHLAGGNESVYTFHHPYICATTFIKEQRAAAAAGSTPLPLPEACISYYAHALGPRNSNVMLDWMDQAKAEEKGGWTHNHDMTSKVEWTTTAFRQSPSMYAANVMYSTNTATWTAHNSAAHHLRYIMGNNVSRHVLYCKVLNAKTWLPRVGFMSPRGDGGENKLKLKVMSLRITSFMRKWAAKQKARRTSAATVIARAVRPWARRRMRKAALLITQMLFQSRVAHLAALRLWVVTRVQAIWRGVRIRNAARKRRAFVRFQATWRGRRARRAVRIIRRALISLVRFQAVCRGIKARRVVGVMRAQAQRKKAATRLVRWYKVSRLHWLDRQARVIQRMVVGATLRHKTKTDIARRQAAARVVQRVWRVFHEQRRSSAFLWSAYNNKVCIVRDHLAHVFFFDNLLHDAFLAQHTLPDGTVPYEVILRFPRVWMYACTVEDPRLLVVHAAMQLRPRLLFMNEVGVGSIQWRAMMCTPPPFFCPLPVTTANN